MNLLTYMYINLFLSVHTIYYFCTDSVRKFCCIHKSLEIQFDLIRTVIKEMLSLEIIKFAI